MIGIEREALRIAPDGTLAQTPHPQALGSPLTNPYISTDFAEAQIEFITPPYASFAECNNMLGRLHTFTAHAIGDELLWPLSMPCHLPEEIEIASYGISDRGHEKHLYRIGLSKRYPIEMQLISGIHLNISFDDTFWEDLRQYKQSSLPMAAFKTQASFDAIRAFLSKGWILTYFFGASPIAPYSTSTRMSHSGYYSKVQRQLTISHDSLAAYLADMHKATTTPHPDYKKIQAMQISDAHLQIPAEHYSRIRPKGNLAKGVDYLEVRSLDINPYSPVGITEEQAVFTRAFLISCLRADPEPLDPCQCENQDRVALHGRDPSLALLRNGKETPLQEWLKELVDGVNAPAPDRPLSEQLAEEIGDDMIAFGRRYAEKHKAELLKNKPDPIFAEVAAESLAQQEALDYEGFELSTTLVVREALKRGMQVEVLDRRDNIIRLDRSVYVKQATKTARDTYITAEIMGNKHVTKQLLREHGINIPRGVCYTTQARALEHLVMKKTIVKPTDANYGIGITVISSQEELASAVQLAFQHSNSIVIEEFFEGNEHRILIIDNRVVSVLFREPANVVGDGSSTIDTLVEEKNRHRPAEYPITTPRSNHIPKQGEKIYLQAISNVSTGGDPISVDIPDHFKKAALQAASAVGSSLCGVDMIINGNDYAIIELNYNPAIWMHAYPYKGKAADVGSAVLDFIMAS